MCAVRSPDVCSCYDFVLQRFAEIAEIDAVAGNPHDQITILFGMRLCIPQCLRIDHVKLDMMPPQREVGPHKMSKIVDTLFAFEKLR